MNSILGYCRVSSEEQAAHGISISAQRDILNGYAAMSQASIRIFEDAGFSGKNTNRPALQQLLAAVRSGEYSSVVVWKLDRLSRSLRDTLTMIEDIFCPAGVSLVSVTESIDTSTPSGRMMLNLLASFAQLEREQDSDRVVMSHKHLARECRYLGGHIPLGYCVDAEKMYHLDPVRSPIARRVFDMYLSRSGYTRIMEYLNAPDVFPLTGRRRPYTKQDLNFMIKNEFYSGTYIRRMGADPRHRITAPETIRVPGGVPSIVTQDEWQRVCRIREQNASGYSASCRAKNVYLLSGLVYCSVCGSLMKVRHGGKTRAGAVERYYSCSSRCVKSARLEHVESAVLTALDYLASDEIMVRRACDIANSFTASDEQENLQAIPSLEKRLMEIARQNARIISFIKEHDNAPASMMDELTALEQEEKQIRQKMDRLRRSAARYDADRTVQALRDAANIKELPPMEQKARIQAAVSKVLVTQDTYQIRLLCPTSSGDEPGHYVEHTVPR